MMDPLTTAGFIRLFMPERREPRHREPSYYADLPPPRPEPEKRPRRKWFGLF